jgi:hypothetical protein
VLGEARGLRSLRLAPCALAAAPRALLPGGLRAYALLRAGERLASIDGKPGADARWLAWLAV